MSIRGWSGNSLILVVGMAVGITAPEVSAQCQYEATIIQGPLCTDGLPARFFFPSALDESGNVAGSHICFIARFASLWTGQGLAVSLSGPSNIDESIPFAMLDPDHIVGQATLIGENVPRAAYWLNGQGTFLPMLPGTNTSQAGGINSSHQIVGENFDNIFGPLQAVLWENGTLMALELPLGPHSVANGINEVGQITGWMGPITTSNAFVYDDGHTTTIPVIPGGQSSKGIAINASGHVVGYGVLDVIGIGATRHALYWDGEKIFDLGALPDHKRSRALDINDLGEIAGISSFVGDQINISHATYWRNGTMHDLNDLLISNPDNNVIGGAVEINNEGWILAGSLLGTVLLKPVGSAPGDIDNNCIVNESDLFLLLDEWGQENSIADVNEDGIVNVVDLIQLLADWG